MKTLEQLENEIQISYLFFGFVAVLFPETVLASVGISHKKLLNPLRWGVRCCGCALIGYGTYEVVHSINQYTEGAIVVITLGLVLLIVMKTKLDLK